MPSSWDHNIFIAFLRAEEERLETEVTGRSSKPEPASLSEVLAMNRLRRRHPTNWAYGFHSRPSAAFETVLLAESDMVDHLKGNPGTPIKLIKAAMKRANSPGQVLHPYAAELCRAGHERELAAIIRHLHKQSGFSAQWNLPCAATHMFCPRLDEAFLRQENYEDYVACQEDRRTVHRILAILSHIAGQCFHAIRLKLHRNKWELKYFAARAEIIEALLLRLAPEPTFFGLACALDSLRAFAECFEVKSTHASNCNAAYVDVCATLLREIKAVALGRDPRDMQARLLPHWDVPLRAAEEKAVGRRWGYVPTPLDFDLLAA